MARVLVVSDDGAAQVEIEQDVEGAAFGVCDLCGERITDRGHFEDTVQAAEVHVDRH
jgi:hypothetical protein